MNINFKKLHEQADNLIGRLPAVKRRRGLRLALKIIKSLSLFALGLFILLIILLSAQIVNFKQIYDQAARGKANLEQAVAMAKRDNFSEAVRSAEQAKNNFTASLDTLERIKRGFIVGNFPVIYEQVNQAQSLLTSAQFLSKAVYSGANFGLSLENFLLGDKKLNFSKFTAEEKRGVLKKIYESAPELNGIKADLSLAQISLEQAGGSGLSFLFKDKIMEARRQISQAKLIFEQAVPLAQIIPALAGYPQTAEFLVMLENSDELRPTGGFLGTYGQLITKDGEILSFETDDIYHLDMPAQAKMNVEPPAPIKKYLNDKWYLRDANWSPDWPTSARKIEWFYRLEKSLANPSEKMPAFNGVIAVTPELVTDFLAVTGPVTVEGQAYDQANFEELLEYRVEKGYVQLGVSKWQRKAVIGEIVKQLKIKIFDLPPDKWTKIVSVIINNLLEKNLLLYFNDSQLEDLAAQSGWGGEIKNHYGDYLLVVDSNLAALKTDAVMKRGLDYKVFPDEAGLTSKLTLSYSHTGGVDWKTSAYKSYTRIYVPLGSQLVELNGAVPGKVDSGSEAGKTWFGFYFMVQPGQVKNILLEYRLPRSLAAGDYSLYIQKQPGKNLEALMVDLSFLNDIKSYSPTNTSTQRFGANRLKWEGDLNIDRSFEIKF